MSCLRRGGVNAFSRYENGKTKPPLPLVKLFNLLDRHPDLLGEVKAVLSVAPARNFGTLVAGTFTAVPVCGLRAARWVGHRERAEAGDDDIFVLRQLLRHDAQERVDHPCRCGLGQPGRAPRCATNPGGQ